MISRACGNPGKCNFFNAGGMKLSGSPDGLILFMLYMLHEGEEEKGNSYLTMIYGASLTRYAERNEESKKTIKLSSNLC